MKRNKGFTLLEMLIVIGCIVALVAIAYPAFGKYQEKNRENADVVAMHSAEALFTTAYNTNKIIDGTPATEATADHPLYYDGDGNLTWTIPTPYGKGTAKDSGVVISCCDDYAYDSAKDYRGGYIYCYYAPEGSDHPGFHIHWMSAGGDIGGSTPVVPTKPTKPTFPTVPATEATEAPTPTVSEPTGSTEETEEPEETTTPPTDPVFDLGNAHPYPVTENGVTTGYPAHVGHKYVYNGSIYVSLWDGAENQNYDKNDGTPENWYRYNFVKANGDLLTDDTYSDKWPNQTVADYGTIFKTTENGETVYYIYKGGKGIVPHPVKNNNGSWVKILDCPNNCGAPRD